MSLVLSHWGNANDPTRRCHFPSAKIPAIKQTVTNADKGCADRKPQTLLVAKLNGAANSGDV